MKLLKLHLLLHLVDDIERFGSPQNFNGGPCEANFKPQKNMAQLTQRRHQNFNYQMGVRLSEYFAFNRAMNECNVNCNTSLDPTGVDMDRPMGGSRFIIQSEMTGSVSTCVVQWQSLVKADDYFQELLQYVYCEMSIRYNCTEVSCFTQHKRGGITFRGDCAFRNAGSWYDWALFNWEGEGQVLGQIYFFVDMKAIQPSQSNKDDSWNHESLGDVCAVISSLTSSNLRPFPGSTLFSGFF